MTSNSFDTAYLDESGDCGTSSKYLVTAMWFPPHFNQISKIIRNAKQQLLNKKKGARWLAQKGGEIKYSGFPDKALLEHTIKKLSKIDSMLYFIAYKKAGKIDKSNKNFVVLNALFSQKSVVGKMPDKIIADIDYFTNDKVAYCVTRLIKGVDGNGEGKAVEFMSKEVYKNYNITEDGNAIKIEHHNSKLNDILQALDLLCGAVFSKYEHSNSKLFDIINGSKIKIEGQEVI